MGKDYLTLSELQEDLQHNDFLGAKRHITINQVFSDERGTPIVDLNIACFCDAADGNNVHRLTLNYFQVKLWMEGTLIQRAFPALNVDNRELLVTGYCPICYEDLFSAPEKEQLL